jgi:hypothetical protein
MSSEHIYHYRRAPPEYASSRFDIIGGLDGIADQYIGGYDDDFDSIVAHDEILVVGASAARAPIKSASTVDPDLLAMFGTLDRLRPLPVIEKAAPTRQYTRRKSVKGREKKKGRGEDPPVRMCDGDEIDCPVESSESSADEGDDADESNMGPDQELKEGVVFDITQYLA